MRSQSVVLHTERLVLRPWRPADWPQMHAINWDPEVTRYLNQPTGPDVERAFEERVLGHWDEYGFGMFAVAARGDEERLLGFVGVAHPTFLPAVAHEVELGWRLARAAWGQGLATEAAVGARDFASAQLGLTRLISIIHPDNARSRRVAAKVGMRVERMEFNPVVGRAVEVWATGSSAQDRRVCRP